MNYGDMPRQRYRVTVFVNVGPLAMLKWDPTDPIAEVDTFEIEAPTPHMAAEMMWIIGQKEPNVAAFGSTDGKRYPLDVRSLCVGDVAKVVDPDGGMTFWVCESIGWRELPEPCNRLVPLEGTRATSRERT